MWWKGTDAMNIENKIWFALLLLGLGWLFYQLAKQTRNPADQKIGNALVDFGEDELLSSSESLLPL
jgi:hypothetical protein